MFRSLTAVIVAFALLGSGIAHARINISVAATDVTVPINTRVESEIPNVFGPAALDIVVNPSGLAPENAYSYAQLDLVNGLMKLKADDSGDLITGQVSASANVNGFYLQNTLAVAMNINPGSYSLLFDTQHVASGSPSDTSAGSGEKSAYVSYVLSMQLFTGSTLVGNGVTQNRMTAVWNEDGSFKERTFTENTAGSSGGFSVATTSFDEAGMAVSLMAPGFTLGAGQSMNLRIGVNLFADAGDDGLIAVANALSTGALSFVLPAGLELLENAPGELDSVADLAFVTVQAVPVPAVALLFPFGLLAGVGWMRCRTHA